VKRFIGVLLALLCAVATAGSAAAQGSFPVRPIRIVIGFGPGGLADITMRILAQKLTDLTGQQVIVENKPGAGGVLAANTVLTAKPDGYTLLVATNGTAISRSLFKTLPFDPVADFKPISIVAYFDVLILVKADSPLHTVGDVLKAGRATSGGFNIGTINPGSTQNLSGELFKSTAKLNATIVPFRGTPDVLTALLRNDIDAGFETYAALKSPIDGGQIRAIAGSGETRSPMLPKVPTVQEGGLPYTVTGWNALVAPAQTPSEIVDYLNRQINVVMAMPDVKQRLLELGTEGRGSTEAELAARLKADIDKWAAVIKQAGIEQQ
jgi:tripartite-type tricarboxylate transporter receptor subunit TctC